ncbi:HAD family hydrolase [Halobacteriales archaeon SW_6_65_46]|nr:MAG: HAD family hydrolase [Halobacteriales archaeon SW_6_65_46]
MGRYAAVLFDLDGTLCQHEQAIEPVFHGAFDDIGVGPMGEPTELWTAMDEITEFESETAQLADGIAGVAADRDRELDARAWAEAFVARLDWRDVTLLPGAETALAAARANGPVGLLTNGPEARQSAKLDALGLDGAFDPVVYAGELDRRKPHAEPFDRAIEALGLDPERVLYVGNSLEHDVAGARDAGLPVAWLDTDGDEPGEHRPTHRLGSIDELAGVLAT